MCFCVVLCTCHTVCFHLQTCNRVVYFYITFVITELIYFEIHVHPGLILFCLLIYKSTFLFTVCQFMLSSCNHSHYGIPNDGGPLSGTTKKLHQYSMVLLIIVSVYTPLCNTHELLCALNIIICLLTYLDLPSFCLCIVL